MIRRRWQFWIVFPVLLGLTLVASPARGDLLIYHIDVGMGDATLIVETSKNRTLLIDAGNRGYGKKVVAPFLKALGHTSINYFIATHYDADHIGGFDELKDEGIEFELIYDRGDYTARKRKTAKDNITQYGEYLRAAALYDRKTLGPTCNENNSVINLGEVTVLVVAARGRYLSDDCTVVDLNVPQKKDNDLSIALKIVYKEFSYFVGGDLTGGGNRTTDLEARIAPTVGDVDVLRLNHHGSGTSSNDVFLGTLLPEVAVISVGNGGANRRYRLPRQVVLDRLQMLSSQPVVFLTNRGEGGSLRNQRVTNGHVVIYTNGRGYNVNGVVFSVDERQ